MMSIAQIKKLKDMMSMLRTSVGEERENYNQAILAYLDACLDGIPTSQGTK